LDSPPPLSSANELCDAIDIELSDGDAGKEGRMATAGDMVLTGTGLPRTRPGGRNGGCLGEVLLILDVRIVVWNKSDTPGTLDVCDHNPATIELCLT